MDSDKYCEKCVKLFKNEEKDNKKSKTFAELVKGYDDFVYQEWDTGEPVGKELL